VIAFKKLLCDDNFRPFSRESSNHFRPPGFGFAGDCVFNHGTGKAPFPRSQKGSVYASFRLQARKVEALDLGVAQEIYQCWIGECIPLSLPEVVIVDDLEARIEFGPFRPLQRSEIPEDVERVEFMKFVPDVNRQ